MIILPKLPSDANLVQIVAWIEQMTVALETEFNERLDIVQTGAIELFASDILPEGYLLCDGEEYSVADFPALGTLLGSTWGAPSAAGLFKVPNIIGKLIVGSDSVATESEVEGGTGSDAVSLLVAIKT